MQIGLFMDSPARLPFTLRISATFLNLFSLFFLAFFFVASFIKSQKDHLCGFMQISGSPTLDWSLEDSDWPSPVDQKIITIEY